MIDTLLERRLGVKVEYGTREQMILGAIDHWCPTCMRQPMRDMNGSNARCDICGKMCMTIQPEKQALLIMNILFLKLPEFGEI